MPIRTAYVLRSLAQQGVSKDGHEAASVKEASFETRAPDAPQDEVV